MDRKIAIIFMIISISVLGCVENNNVKYEENIPKNNQNNDKYILIEYSEMVNKTVETNTAPEGKEYFILKVNIQNYGYEAFDTNPIQWSLTYNNVRGYHPTIVPIKDSINVLDILDGGSTAGKIVFEIPESGSYTYTINYEGIKGSGMLGKMQCLTENANNFDTCFIKYNIKWKKI